MGEDTGIDMRFAVIGAGAIGSLFGAYLSRAGHYVVLNGRTDHMRAIERQKGIYLVENDEKHLIKVYAGDITEEEFDYVFITTKAFSLETVVDTIKKLKDDTTIVIMQNGLGNEDVLVREGIDISRIIRGITSEGAILEKPGLVRHTGSGGTVIGGYCLNDNLNSSIIRLSEVLNGAGLITEVSDNINKSVWEKCVINSVINPLGAILRKKNGEIRNMPEFDVILEGIISEAELVARAEGVMLTKETLKNKVLYVMEKTYENKNSMFIDIEKGKRTEIDYINGAIVSLGRKHGIETPYNLLLTSIIKAMEGEPPEISAVR